MPPAKGKKAASSSSSSVVKNIIDTDSIVTGKGLSNFFYAIDPEFAMWYEAKSKMSGDLVRHILTGSTNDFTQYPNFNSKPACLPFPYEYRNSKGQCSQGVKVPLWAMILADNEGKRKFPQWSRSFVVENLKITPDDILKQMIINQAFKGGEDVAMLYILFKKNPSIFNLDNYRPVTDTRYQLRAKQ